jgi:hypothetical protein
MRRIGICVIVLVLALMAPATAHSTTFKSTVTATLAEPASGDSLIKGVVKSPKPGCIPRRRVKVFYVDEGPDTLIASDLTGRAGKWSVNLGASPAPGKYYGSLIRRNIGTGSHRHICLDDTSSRVTIIETDPTIIISHPEDGKTYPSGATVPFMASASDPQDGTLSGSSIVWTSDIDGQIGTGESISYALSDGIHVITATATDNDANTGTDSIQVELS